MQIQSGKLYENRTWKYLYPCLKYYDEELINQLGGFFKLGVGIADYNITTEENCLFILIDTNIRLATANDVSAYKRRFSKFLDWLQYQSYYKTDYVFTGLDSSEKHMIVIKIPEAHKHSYNAFIEGKYSEMYSQSEINKYFNILPNKSNNPNIIIRNEKINEVKLVLNKDKQLIPIFVNRVNKDYNTTITVEDYKDAELDYPAILEEEIFNYRGL